MAISEQLQQRIDGLIGAQGMRGLVQPTRGAISDRDMDLFRQASPSAEAIPMPYDPSSPSDTRNLPYDPRNEQHAIPMPYSPSEQLTPEDKQRLLMEIESAQIRENAPMGLEAQQIQEMGTGEDQFLVHTEMGDTIIPPQMLMDDPELESMLERKFMDYNINPEERVVGSGIASLNPQTGLPEYGFFKKLIRGIGKVVKKVAPVAAFIPGIGTALGGVLGGIGGGITGAIGTVAPRLASGLGSLGSTVMGGISSLGIPGVSSITGGTAGGFGGIQGALTTKAGLFGGGPFSGLTGAPDYYAGGPGSDPQSIAKQQVRTQLEQARAQAVASGNMEDVAKIDAYLNDPSNQVAQLGPFGGTLGPKLFGTGQPQIIGTDPATGAPIYQQAGSRVAQGLGGFIGGQGGGGLFGGSGGDFLKNAGIGALAASLGKLAYEDTKNMKGVPITPMTAMGPTGRFNIEAEIARRRGLEAPNPVEFGLLPQGTIPELSGGKPIMNAAYGGEVRGVPMSILRPTAVPSMMPLPQAPINFEIPESYLAAKDAMRENIETPETISPERYNTPRQFITPDAPASSPLAPLLPRMPLDYGMNNTPTPREFIGEVPVNIADEVSGNIAENPRLAYDFDRPRPLDYGMNNTPTPRQFIGEGAPPSIGRPLPLPIERPPMQYIGEGAPPTGKSLPELLRNINMPFSGLMGDRMPIKGQETLGGLSSITEKIRRRGRGMRGMKKRSMGGEIRNYNMGGALRPMAYADGGDVAMQDFQQMNGQINGIGTETSDEIPAMLSDGEFVMTGRGVRGAGSYVMEKNQGGIISLVPSLGEDRERGTQLMYGLMDEFGSRANG